MKFKILFVLCILFLSVLMNASLSSCEQVSERTVIKIECVEITEYELEKRMNTALPADSLNMYIDNFIDRAYILAEATSRGYMENPKIDKTVQKMAEMILMQTQGGLLYEEVVNKNIMITDSDVMDAYNKEKKLINAECLIFPNYPEMAAVLGRDSLMTSVDTFKKYVSQCENNPKVEFQETKLSWPFMDFILYQDYLCTLKEDEISFPLNTSMGVCVLHITRIEDKEQPSFEIRKEILRKVYELAEEQKGMMLYDDELIASAKIEINYDTVEKIYSGLNIGESNSSIEKSTYKDNLNEKVMSFYLEGEYREITVEDFIDHYKSQLMIRRISSRSMLNIYFKNWVILECGYREAVKLGITKTKQFVLDRKNYKYNVVYGTFIREELERKITVNNNEIIQAYNDRIDSFEGGTHAKISVFRFDSMENSFMEYIKLNELISKEILREIDIPDSTEGFIGKDIEITVNHDSKDFPPHIMNALFSADNNVLMQPADIGGQFVVIYKHSESGSRIKPLEEVRNEIGQQLYNEKLEKAKTELLSELKKKYPIENNIDYDKYLKTAGAVKPAANAAF